MCEIFWNGRWWVLERNGKLAGLFFNFMDAYNKVSENEALNVSEELRRKYLVRGAVKQLFGGSACLRQNTKGVVV